MAAAVRVQVLVHACGCSRRSAHARRCGPLLLPSPLTGRFYGLDLPFACRHGVDVETPHSSYSRPACASVSSPPDDPVASLAHHGEVVVLLQAFGRIHPGRRGRPLDGPCGLLGLRRMPLGACFGPHDAAWAQMRVSSIIYNDRKGAKAWTSGFPRLAPHPGQSGRASDRIWRVPDQFMWRCDTIFTRFS